MSNTIRYEDMEKYVRSFGYKVLRRLHAAGCKTVQLEDVMGELMMAWVEARNHFDPQKGVPFVPYAIKGMMNHINRWAQKEVNCFYTAPKSMDEALPLYKHSGRETTRHDVLTVDEPTVEEVTVSQDMALKIMRELSEDAQTYVTLLHSPPEWLVAEQRALAARAQYGRDRGMTSVAPKYVNSSLVMEAMGLTRNQRKLVYEEVRKAIERVSSGKR